MTRKAKSLQFSILIVCEGSSTEPNYFNGLLQQLRLLGTYEEGVSLIIEPKPSQELSSEDSIPVPHKSARKKRSLLPEKVPLLEDGVEDEFRADPVRYVRAAQLGLQKDGYDLAFAVFDKDGHPAIEAAFQLAEAEIEGKKVNIGFSSICFEQWILLHFERSEFAFEKSECKDAFKKPYGCGSKHGKKTCLGNRCVIGYIGQKGYLDFKKNDSLIWAKLFDKIDQAFLNAAWLRQKQVLANPSRQTFELNPYSNIDQVLATILKKDLIYYAELGADFVHEEIAYLITIDGNLLSIRVQNQTRNSFLLKLSNFNFQPKEAIPMDSSLKSHLVVGPGEVNSFGITIPSFKSKEEVFLRIQLAGTKTLVIPIIQDEVA